MKENSGHNRDRMLSRRTVAVWGLGVLCGLILDRLQSLLVSRLGLGEPTGIVTPLGKENGWGSFPEPPWVVEGATLARKVVAETPFARFEIHKVKTENGQIVTDWLWTDERSHVNILVHVKEGDKYLMFRQRKYGLKEPKLAVIGGLFNSEKETAEECAKRELLEETGLEAGEWINLGAYRVQVNRGGGILHAFLAKDSIKSSKRHNRDGEYETQTTTLMTGKELTAAALNGEVGEAQWVAAVALGLLHAEHKEHHLTG